MGHTRGQSEELVDLVVATQGGAHRPIHAAGMGLVGSFTPALDADSFSCAKIFSEASTPVTARFSDGVGNLHGDQRKPDVRGLAVRFHIDGGGELDMIAMTLPTFFAKTPDQFESFSRASVPCPMSGVENGTALKEWLWEHPTSLAAIEFMRTNGIDKSYGGATFHSVHAFNYVAADGTVTSARFAWVPDVPEKQLPRDADLSKERPDRLRRELAERIRDGRGPGFSLVMQVKGPADDTADPTKPWMSTDNRTVGHLHLSGFVSDPYWDCEAVHFNPTRLVEGIELSDDEILHARGGAYATSAERRTAAYPPPTRLPFAQDG